MSNQRSSAAVLGLMLTLLAPPLGTQLEAAPAQPSRGDGTAQVSSRVVVTVPGDEKTSLSVEGAPVEAAGQTREFNTPPLEPGRMYRYTFTATWRPNSYTLMTRTQTVEFVGGDEIVLDMTRDDPNDRAEIRYVPTPDDVVATMIELANVGPDDVVYEPGCGDARITISAVRAGAARGVGIDLDAQRVAEATANVKAANLDDKVEIRLGDALDIKDLSSATVVFLYMGDEFDALIRPILWNQLAVGSRVVSHRFTMGDWKPDRTAHVTVGDEAYAVHLWTITEEVKAKAAAAR